MIANTMMFRIISLIATFIFSAIFIAGTSMAITTKGELGAILVVMGILGACASAVASTLTFFPMGRKERI